MINLKIVMKNKFSTEIIVLLSFTFLFGGILGGIGVYMRMRGMNQRIELLRVLSVGKSEEEVIAYMGEPNSIKEKVQCNGLDNCTALEYYSSGLYSKTHKTGPDDIKVVLDSKGKIASVYYTDYPWEKLAYSKIIQN